MKDKSWRVECWVERIGAMEVGLVGEGMCWRDDRHNTTC